MSISFFLQPDVSRLFVESGLDSFEILMNSGSGKVQRLVLKDGSRFYLKREVAVRLAPSLAMLRRGHCPYSAPLRELRLLQLLRLAGFLTMEPVAWGEQRRFGFPMRGFLVVREVRGEEAAVFFDQADGMEKRQLMKAIGRLVGRLHARGFFHPVRLKDLIYTVDGLVLIDRETSKPWRSLFFPQQCRDSLARAIRRIFRDGHRIGAGSACAFFQGYRRGVAERWKISSRDLTSQICIAVRSEFES